MAPEPIKAVIDTNLFVSGMFAKGSLSAELQDMWIRQKFVLVTSIAILREVSQVLRYPHIVERFQPDEQTVRQFFRLAFRKAIVSRDEIRINKIAADPDDNKFLACAIEKQADYIVSRDPHLRNLKHFQGIQIVDARTFIDLVKAGR